MEEYPITSLFNSEMLTNGTFVNTTTLTHNGDSVDLAEAVRMVHLIVRPILVMLGTEGNIVSNGGSRISRWGGGRRPVGGGGANLRRIHFSAKTKEIDPVGV